MNFTLLRVSFDIIMSQLESTHSSSLGTPLLSSNCSVSTFPRDLPLLKAYRITMAPRLIAWSCWFRYMYLLQWSLDRDDLCPSNGTTIARIFEPSAIEHQSMITFSTQAVDLTHQERTSWPIDGCKLWKWELGNPLYLSHDVHVINRMTINSPRAPSATHNI